MGYEKVHTINPIGYSGGLAVFWKKNVKVCVKSSDKNIVDLFVQIGDLAFYLTCVFGEPATDGISVVWRD